jgi:uncharacterized membrane protein
MSAYLEPAARWCAMAIEALGVGAITVTALYAVVLALAAPLRNKSTATAFRDVRQRLGRGILLGLEFLVAADIVHTVAVELTFASVGVLAIIVAIRTFLSFTLELELTGRWPWQPPTKDAS